MTPYDKALAFVLKEEGGYVNNPRDPGGITNLGVTKRAWETYLHHPVDEAAMRALTVADVTPFYRTQYWNAVMGDKLPAGIGLAVFDLAVNGGVRRASKMLQELVGEKNVDGWIGAATFASLSRHVDQHGIAHTIGAYVDARRAFYRSLSTFPTFGKGWLARCDRVEQAALGAAR
jgi:lysozyme family protein